MPDLQKLQQYMIPVDQLIEVAEKEDIAECARLLAMNVAHYKSGMENCRWKIS